MLNEIINPAPVARSVACELYNRAEEMDVRLDYLVEELTRLTNMLDKRVFTRPAGTEPVKVAAGNPERLGILADLDYMSRIQHQKLDKAFGLLRDITDLVE